MWKKTTITSAIENKMNTLAKRHESTQSVYLEANIISEWLSFLAAFQNVIKALMKRSKNTSWKYHKGTLKKTAF